MFINECNSVTVSTRASGISPSSRKTGVHENHEKILSIIKEHRYLAVTDSEFEKIIETYIKNVKIYKAFLDAGINEFAGVAGDAPY
jgi:hypothetical protein